MVIVAGILMLALSVFAVAYPFFQPLTPSSRLASVSSDEELADLLTRRDATYAALKELELDHETGKLSLSDYQVMRDQSRAQAVAILQELDACQTEAQVRVAEERALDQEIEREIEREIAVRRQGRRDPNRCLDCGAAFEPGDRFCRRCGTIVSQCPDCGASFETGDHFCGRCGVALEMEAV
ncbi:MAG: zinc ribbon domain-containing protein [Anaerolineae bacterium]